MSDEIGILDRQLLNTSSVQQTDAQMLPPSLFINQQAVALRRKLSSMYGKQMTKPFTYNRVGFFSDSHLLKRPILATLLLVSLTSSTWAQENNNITRLEVMPTGQWLEPSTSTFKDTPILLHLRTGYERAILMPEPVRQLIGSDTLPGCEVEIDNDVLIFYPSQNFQRSTIRLFGEESGKEYVVRVRASATGIRQPLQIITD